MDGIRAGLQVNYGSSAIWTALKKAEVFGRGVKKGQNGKYSR